MVKLKPFTSLTSLRSAHRKLLERRAENGETAEYLVEIGNFIQCGTLTGALLDARSDRWQAQNLLDYWANELYQARHDAPDTTLTEFNPASAPVIEEELCPYLGLKTFGPNKHLFFFGREMLVDSMVEKLKYNRFLAIAGPSGSGKSSVALAGLMPQLQKGALHGSRQWRYYAPMVPGADPQANLARIINPEQAADLDWVQQIAERSQQDPLYLAKMIDSASDQPAVIVVDQFDHRAFS